MIWLNSNASNRSKLFNVVDLHSPNEKNINFLKIFLLNKRLYLKFCDQIENEIPLKDFFDFWTHLSITFYQTKEKAEFSIYHNGLLICNFIYNYKKNEMNLFNDSMELSIGFDVPLKKKQSILSEKNKEELEFFRVGPFLLFSEALLPNEINLIYSITDSSLGTVNFIRKEHYLNFNRISIENFKNFDFSFYDFCEKNSINSENYSSKTIVKVDISYLLGSLIIEEDANFLCLVKAKESNSFLFQENNKKTLVLLNKAERSENSQGVLINESNYSDFFNENFESLRNENLNIDFLLDIIISSFEKTDNRENFIEIFRILKKLCEKFEDEIKNEQISTILEILKQKQDFFRFVLIEELFCFFSKKIKNDKKFDHSNNYLITSIRNFRIFFMEADFYRVFFNNSLEILSFFELFFRTFFNPKFNVFSELFFIFL